MNIYLDESGDTGWILDQPYPRGGSSRYLVIAALLVPTSHDKHPERALRGLYKQRQWSSREKKWTDMSPSARNAFACSAAALFKKYPEISCHAIVVNKRKVGQHLYGNENLLYNYMTKLLLLDEMAKYPVVHLVPDARSIKVESARSFDDYLQTQLYFEAQVSTRLTCRATDSQHCLNLQFTDMVAGAIASYYEFRQSEAFERLQPHLNIKKLFF
jgi:hypothetical protein